MRDDDFGPLDPTPEGWLDWTSAKQALASDPARSAWVSANAGSGKTHVLTQRVIRLLLSGCRPSAILCLTYTKAAASEMSNRVFERLAEWVTLDDDTLDSRIAAIEGERPDLLKRQEARRLFARALETPGGLKIQTIHAFCEALLHQFPLEANVAGHFSVLDDRASATLLADARRALLTATASEDDRELTEAFATVLDLADDTGLEKLLSAIVDQRTPIQLFLDDAARKGGIDPALRTALGLRPDETRETALAAFWPLPGLNGAGLERYVGMALSAGGAKVSDFAEGLRAVARLFDPLQRYNALIDLFYTQAGKPRADSAFLSKGMRDKAPDLEDLVFVARDHMIAATDRLNVIAMFEATKAALVLADRLNSDYEDIKKSRSQLDFDDLINRTATLLVRGDVSRWIHYKLDQGIDHILVDEAQDTSPVQWTIIQSLAEDFFSGETARGGNRTMFAVGDEKQSIYSFQGARPERFSNESIETERRVVNGGKAFSPIRLQLSFRSTEDVLSAVDTVFENPVHAKGLSARSDTVVHASNRIGHPGLVEVWDAIAPADSIHEDDWTAPFDATPEDAPANILAQRIAAVLADWIGRETVIEKGVRRPMQPGDVIVLVRKRDAFVNALTRALKTRRNIPVAGADRLVLTNHIAVQDLMALGRFVLLPQDDLSLAALLKSPLFNLTETDIAELAAGRPASVSLWQRLNDLGGDEASRYRPALVALQRYRLLSRTLPVHDFYAGVLGHDGGRAAFLGRLGSEVSDILDEFLTFALDHEKNGLPGLQAFISGLEMEAPTVKREQDKERNEVRIMTVHAAKGLEAPVVFLVDGGGKAFNSQHVSGLRMIRRDDRHDTIPLPVWRPPGAASNALIDADTTQLKTAAEEEYRRLLYVGMTRAADRLIVCGYQGKRANPESWHAMVTASLSTDERGRSTPVTFATSDQEWTGYRWQVSAVSRDLKTQEIKEEANIHRPDLPSALSTPLPPQRHLPRPLSPSGAGVVIDEDETGGIVGSALFSRKAGPGSSLLRGAILHRFLQVLPSIAPEERRAAAERYLLRSVPRWSEAERQALITSVLNVMRHDDLRDLFSETSRAEVSVMGTLALGKRDFAVSGRIDRLAVSGNTVIIADFKTNREIPASVEGIPFIYQAQLAIYRALLAPLYPGHLFQCVLIYTEGPTVLTLPQEMLDASLVDLATK
ncbi:MAG TPA: double-strand break repair helicase AddA [Pararhizobium sp.]|uniref:double-strand break repair helicase AddA n=1 Tax=Pararhizobium sp. TaxID=1977563 RepID=UPI002CE0E54F|nr:double-strand break repair helicase AddA [Pararhizobium sp.]HTO30726.1 double-strand break repair helicase AddA [Pararhizobium sp.]